MLDFLLNFKDLKFALQLILQNCLEFFINRKTKYLRIFNNKFNIIFKFGNFIIYLKFKS